MPTNTSQLTRQELYEQVWATSLRKIAAAYDLPAVHLAKICDAHDIPRPDRGHWVKKKFGKEPARTPLPECDDPALQTIQLLKPEPQTSRPLPKQPESESKPAPEPEYDEDIMLALERACRLPKTVVATTLRNLHPLVACTKKAIKDVPTDEHNMVRPMWSQREESLCISVSKPSVRRGLAFLDALIKAVERVGGKVEVVEDQWSRSRQVTSVSFCGEKVTTIRLRERYKQMPRTTPRKDPLDWYKCDFVPTGRMLLDNGPSSCGTPHCKDTEKGDRIEDKINDMVIEWVHEAGRVRLGRRNTEEIRLRREEEERLQREREAELQRQRGELQQRQLAEQRRVDDLCAEAADWKQSQTLREYISRVGQVTLAREGGIAADGELALWLEWAHQQADRLDPLTPSPPSVLDEHT